MANPIEPVDVLIVDGDRVTRAADRVAAEVALEVRLQGEPFAIIMRTPGADLDLAAGFLLSEGVLRHAADLARAESTDSPDIVNLRVAPHRAEAASEFLGQRRLVAMNASCGLCGRRTLESLTLDRPPLDAAWRVGASVVRGMTDRLRAAQQAFSETGGLHAAGLFDRTGSLECSAEDVGRHNAVDKLVGRMLMAGQLPLGDRLLLVSGRASFEIILKAFVAGIPLVAAVSAPSSLAVDLVERCGITLVGFVRGDRFNIYTHPDRIDTNRIDSGAMDVRR